MCLLASGHRTAPHRRPHQMSVGEECDGMESSDAVSRPGRGLEASARKRRRRMKKRTDTDRPLSPCPTVVAGLS